MSGTSLRAGVIGWPVSHSRSPKLHGYWLRQYSIDGRYDAIAVRPEDLAEFIRDLSSSGFRGCNVTIPHKQAVLPLMDEVDGFARRIGAVNTIVITAAGRLHGSNTDGYGFLQNLADAIPGFRADRGPAVVLGAGGAARAVVAALIDAGVPELRLLNRSLARAEALATTLGGPIAVRPLTEAAAALAGAALLVNTTSLGMTGQPPLQLDLRLLPTDAVVNDIVYVPLTTPLLSAAAARGNPVVDGLGMLLHQARPGFRAWFGVDPAVTPGLRAAVLAD